jgi:hypothetical protein
MKLRYNNKSVIGFIGLVVFRLLLDWVYFNIISPIYAYSGFIDNRNAQNLIVSWGIFILFYFFMKRILYTEQEGVLHVIVSLLYLLSFIPFTSSIYAGITPPAFILWNSMYWIVLILASSYALQLPKKRLPKVNLNNLEIGDRFVAIVGFISLVVVVYVSARYTGFRLNFNLFTVYDLRLEAREFGMPTLVTYLFAWTKAVNTLMLAFCLIKDKKLMSILYFSIQMLSFGIDGSKSTFFLPFLVLLVVKLYDKITVGKLKMLFFYGAAGGTLLAIAEKMFANSIYLTTLFIRRVLYVPSILNVYYFDYFTSHEPDLFRGSFLRLVGAVSPYAVDGGISRMIGKVYFGSATMNCNNGLLSDAISNLGHVGIFIMPIVIVFFLHLLDRSTYGLDKRLILVSGVFIALNLISTSFTTVLITHGFLLIILLTWVMKPEDLYNPKAMLEVN